MLFLAIESSCDETAAAVIDEQCHLHSSVVHSQIDIHRPFSGVVPELASRNHIVMILPVIDQALADAHVDLAQIDGLAVTYGPGLVGSLLVGLETAKGIARARDLPLIPVNHIAGHLCAVFLQLDDAPPPPAHPFLGLAVSGGHTHLYLARAPGRYELVGRTLDDAAGEAFDKVAKMLGLGYPGGIEIDRHARLGDAAAIDFPRALKRKTSLDFSFSGLKTAVRTHLQRFPTQSGPMGHQHLCDVCASFQEAVVDVLVRKSITAARLRNIDRLVVAGGVAANSRLRSAMQSAADDNGILLWFPKIAHCTDNAAMIGAAAVGELVAAVRHHEGFEAAGVNAIPNLSL